MPKPLILSYLNSIALISPSVVGISVINNSSNASLSWQIKDGIFSPYTKKDSIISVSFHISNIF